MGDADADAGGVDVLRVGWVFAVGAVGSGGDESNFCSSVLELPLSCCMRRQSALE